jgi:hypothetical protein
MVIPGTYPPGCPDSLAIRRDPRDMNEKAMRKQLRELADKAYEEELRRAGADRRGVPAVEGARRLEL